MHPAAASAPRWNTRPLLGCAAAVAVLGLGSCASVSSVGSGIGALWDRAVSGEASRSTGGSADRSAGREPTAAATPTEGDRSRFGSIFTPYRPTVQQGNYLTREQLDQLKEGMTRSQVQFLLGQPLLNAGFRDDRWEYVFRMQWADLRADTRRVTVYFDAQQRVARVQADDLPLRDDGRDPAVPGYRPPRGNAR